MVNPVIALTYWGQKEKMNNEFSIPISMLVEAQTDILDQ